MGKIIVQTDTNSYEYHGNGKLPEQLMEAIVALGWDQLMDAITEAVKGLSPDDKAAAAYECVKAVSKNDENLSLSPYSGPPVTQKPGNSTQGSINKGASSSHDTGKYGYHCMGCGTFNPDASANQPGDKYLCFNCRC